MKILEKSFAKKCQRVTNATSQKWSGEQTLEPKRICFVFTEKLFVIPITRMFLLSNNNGLSISIKISWVIKNLKISVDSAFSFWAIEPKRKGGIRGISRKAYFRRTQSDQNYFCCKESIVNSFIYKFHTKVWGGRNFLKHWRWRNTRI